MDPNEGGDYDKAEFNSRSLFAESQGRSATTGWLCRLILIVLKILFVFSMGAWFVMHLESSREQSIEAHNKDLMMNVSETGDTARFKYLLAYSSLGQSAAAWALYEEGLKTPSERVEVYRQAISRLRGKPLFNYIKGNAMKLAPAQYAINPDIVEALDPGTIRKTMACFKSLGIYYEPETYNPDLVGRSPFERRLRAAIADLRVALPTSEPPCHLTPTAIMDSNND